jgi:DNA adenine methylase
MESTPLHARVAAVRPVAPYVGGKRNLAGRLVKLIESVPHEIYAEPFVGMGGVFLRRTSRPKAEVINDWSRDVATLFRVLQRHYVAFLEMIRFQLTTRSEFERLTAVDPDTLTDLERAARFLYLQRNAFGGKVVGRNFAMGDPTRGARFDVTRIAPMLEDLHARLAGVVIERLPFDRFVSRYDRPGTLFYCDPPYWGAEDYYGAEVFSREDFTRLRDSLASIRGRFILSINDTPGVRDLFGGFQIEPVSVIYSVQAAGSQAVGELIISGP